MGVGLPKRNRDARAIMFDAKRPTLAYGPLELLRGYLEVSIPLIPIQRNVQLMMLLRMDFPTFSFHDHDACVYALHFTV
jgi:hypothetical protein